MDEHVLRGRLLNELEAPASASRQQLDIIYKAQVEKWTKQKTNSTNDSRLSLESEQKLESIKQAYECLTDEKLFQKRLKELRLKRVELELTVSDAEKNQAVAKRLIDDAISRKATAHARKQRAETTIKTSTELAEKAAKDIESAKKLIAKAEQEAKAAETDLDHGAKNKASADEILAKSLAQLANVDPAASISLAAKYRASTMPTDSVPEGLFGRLVHLFRWLGTPGKRPVVSIAVIVIVLVIIGVGMVLSGWRSE